MAKIIWRGFFWRVYYKLTTKVFKDRPWKELLFKDEYVNENE